MGLDRLGQGRNAGVHHHVGQDHRKGLVADDVAGAPHRVAQAQGLHLAHEAHLAGARQFAEQLLEDLGLALALQLQLHLDLVVEIVLQGLLAAAGDEDEVLDPRRAGLGHRIGDDRPIDHVQQLLGHRLGAGQHPGAEAGDRQDRLANLLSHGRQIS